MARAFALPALLLALASAAGAHERTVSYSTWDVDGAGARVSVRLMPLDVSRFPWAATANPDLDRRLGTYLADHLTLEAGGTRCPVVQAPERRRAAGNAVVVEWRVVCPSGADWRISSSVLLDVAPSHLHFARLRRPGRPPLERVLSDAQRAWAVGDAAAPPAGSPLADYVRLGMEHILTGYDHLVFLLALLLLGGTLRDIVRIVTGFTVAHSLTLALAVLGTLRPARAPIEALIGFSIALVAAENLWLAAGRGDGVRRAVAAAVVGAAAGAAAGWGCVPALTLGGLACFAYCYFGLLQRMARPAPLRAAVAFLFGLVHGFGFAGVLVEADLPAARLVPALFGFNAGVEIGQLAAVAALWPLLRFVARHDEGRLHRAVVEYGSAAILAVGIFWFASRAYGR